MHWKVSFVEKNLETVWILSARNHLRIAIRHHVHGSSKYWPVGGQLGSKVSSKGWLARRLTLRADTSRQAPSSCHPRTGKGAQKHRQAFLMHFQARLPCSPECTRKHTATLRVVVVQQPRLRRLRERWLNCGLDHLA